MTTYPIFGMTTAPMLGRKIDLKQLCDRLTKDTPDHISVVGVKHIGKTVFLKHVCANSQSLLPSYMAAIYWDLRHGTPMTDLEFREALASRIAEGIDGFDASLASEIRNANQDKAEVLRTVLSIFSSDKKRILLILDGLDRVLSASSITRNLWDYLRDLAQEPSLRFVTGSCKTLRQICSTEESQTSDFWEIFAQPHMRLFPFTRSDLEDFIVPLQKHGFEFAPETIDSILYQTAGIPVITASLLNQVKAMCNVNNHIASSEIEVAAQAIIQNNNDLLTSLWEVIPLESRKDMARLSEIKIDQASLKRERIDCLLSTGLAAFDGRILVPTCQILYAYMKDIMSELHAIDHLFSDQNYTKNLQSVLELRLSRIVSTDSVLERLKIITRSLIVDAGREATASLDHIRGVLDCAVEIIWYGEAPGVTRKLPPEWIQATKSGDKGLDSFAHKVEQLRGGFPSSSDRATSLMLIDMITREPRKLAKRVSRPTYILLSHLKTVGDFINHRYEIDVSGNFTISICMTAVELCASLSTDLAVKANT